MRTAGCSTGQLVDLILARGHSALVLGLPAMLLALGACEKKPSGTGEPKGTVTATTSAGAAAAAAVAAGQSGVLAAPHTGAPAGQGRGEAGLKGTILETIEVGKYTYLRLDRPDGETWAAVPRVRLSAGQRVAIANPMPMRDFESKTLKRKFGLIYFGTLDTSDTTQERRGATEDKDLELAHRGVKQGTTPALGAPLAKAEGREGRTIAEIYEQRDKLKDATVAVRGKVVRVNSGIMGRNWVHVQDGTRSSSGAHDLTVTTQEPVQIDQVIVLQGTLGLDRDFGAGYRYPVILEGASVRK